jgi:hypothetical protein
VNNYHLDIPGAMQEMEYLQTFAVIAFFIGGKPPEHLMSGWMEKLKEQA